MLGIQDRNVKLFDRKILQLVAEYLMHITRAANGDAVLAILNGHPATQLERRMNLNRSRIANPGQRRQRGDRLG